MQSVRVLPTPQAGLPTLFTDVVGSQIDVRDSAVLLDGLSQCLDCGTRSTTQRGNQHEAPRTRTAGLTTRAPDSVALKVDGRDGAVLLQGFSQCLECDTKSNTLRGNQREVLLTPTAGLCTLVTNLVPFQVNGRDGAVLIEGLSQCLDGSTRSATLADTQGGP